MMEDKEKQYLEWLAGLRVGDKWHVVDKTTAGLPVVATYEITSETAKFWRLKSDRLFSKETGVFRGESRYKRIDPPSSPEDVAAAVAAIRSEKKREMLKSLDWKALSNDKIDRILAIIREGTDEA